MKNRDRVRKKGKKSGIEGKKGRKWERKTERRAGVALTTKSWCWLRRHYRFFQRWTLLYLSPPSETFPEKLLIRIHMPDKETPFPTASPLSLYPPISLPLSLSHSHTRNLYSSPPTESLKFSVRVSFYFHLFFRFILSFFHF